MFQLVTGTSSLWHYMFSSVVLISIQGGWGPCVYAVSCVGASSIVHVLVIQLPA
jgi:hypothetical protein